MALSKHGFGGCATSRDAGIAEGRKLVQRNIVRSGQAAGGMQELSLMVHGQNTPWRFLQHFGGIKVLPSCVLVREDHGYCCNMATLQGQVLV